MSFLFKKGAKKKADPKSKEPQVSFEEKYNLLNHYLKELQKENDDLKQALQDQRETSRKNKTLLDEFLNNVPSLDPDLSQLKNNIDAIHKKVDDQSHALEVGMQTKVTGRNSTASAITSDTRSTHEMTPTRSHMASTDQGKDQDSLNEFHLKQDELLSHIANMRKELSDLQSVQKTLGSEAGGDSAQYESQDHSELNNEENNPEDADDNNDDDEEEEEKISEAIEELCHQAEENDNVLFFVDSKQQMWQLIQRPDISFPGQEEAAGEIIRTEMDTSVNEDSNIEISAGEIVLNQHKLQSEHKIESENHHPNHGDARAADDGDKELEDDSLFAGNENSSEYVNTEPGSDEEVSEHDAEMSKNEVRVKSHHNPHHHHHNEAESERHSKDQSYTNNSLSFSTSVQEQ